MPGPPLSVFNPPLLVLVPSLVPTTHTLSCILRKTLNSSNCQQQHNNSYTTVSYNRVASMAHPNSFSDREMAEPQDEVEEEGHLVIPGLENLPYNRRLRSTNPAAYLHTSSEDSNPC